MTALAASLLGSGLAASIVLLVAALAGWQPPARSLRMRGPVRAMGMSRNRLLAALVVGTAAAVLTRWPVMAVTAAVVVCAWPAMVGASHASRSQMRNCSLLPGPAPGTTGLASSASRHGSRR